MIRRGEIYWADLADAQSSRPAKRRPISVVQVDPYTGSSLATVLVVVVTSNTPLAAMPLNVFLPVTVTSLPRESAVNATAVVTLNKTELTVLSVASFDDDIEQGRGRVGIQALGVRWPVSALA